MVSRFVALFGHVLRFFWYACVWFVSFCVGLFTLHVCACFVVFVCVNVFVFFVQLHIVVACCFVWVCVASVLVCIVLVCFFLCWRVFVACLFLLDVFCVGDCFLFHLLFSSIVFSCVVLFGYVLRLFWILLCRVGSVRVGLFLVHACFCFLSICVVVCCLFLFSSIVPFLVVLFSVCCVCPGVRCIGLFSFVLVCLCCMLVFVCVFVYV